MKGGINRERERERAVAAMGRIKTKVSYKGNLLLIKLKRSRGGGERRRQSSGKKRRKKKGLDD